MLNALAVNVQRVVGTGWQIVSLASEADPVIESGTGIVVVASHVPLPDERGRVTAALQVLRKENCSLRNEPIVIDDAVLMRVEPGQYRSATGTAQRRGHERVFQVGTV